jgi:hypothetical protein
MYTRCKARLRSSGGNTIGYHVRKGRHNLTPYDWSRDLDFGDKHLK